MEELRNRARKDFDELKILCHDDIEWQAFWLGYLAAIKRFGGK